MLTDVPSTHSGDETATDANPSSKEPAHTVAQTGQVVLKQPRAGRPERPGGPMAHKAACLTRGAVAVGTGSQSPAVVHHVLQLNVSLLLLGIRFICI